MQTAEYLSEFEILDSLTKLSEQRNFKNAFASFCEQSNFSLRLSQWMFLFKDCPLSEESIEEVIEWWDEEDLEDFKNKIAHKVRMDVYRTTGDTLTEEAIAELRPKITAELNERVELLKNLDVQALRSIVQFCQSLSKQPVESSIN